MGQPKCLPVVCATLLLFAACTSQHQPSSAGEIPTASGSASPSPFQTPPGKIPHPLSRGFVVVDSTWISDETGWVLGGRGCEGPDCSIIVKTVDGGAHWQRVNAPRAFVFAKGQFPQAPSTDVISHIRFANASVGYAFGSTFFMTTDGGHMWVKQGSRHVADLEISRGRAARLSYGHSGCPGPCNVTVEIASVGSTQWKRVFSPTTYNSVAIAIQASTIYVAAFGNPAGGANDAHTSFWRSSDLGASWVRFDDPCGEGSRGENDASDFTPTPDGDFIVECRPRGENPNAFIVESRDGGVTFGPRRPLPVQLADALAAPSGTKIAVTDFQNGRGVLVSRDSGRTWVTTLTVQPAPDQEQPTPAPDSKSVESFIGFQDALTARASFGTAHLWTSRDGGDTWHRSAPFAGF